MSTTNEAAERLVPLEYDDTNFETCPLCGDDGLAGDMRAKLITWFAAERRATVERIRTHLLSELPAPMAPGDEILWSTVVAILDEEAAS